VTERGATTIVADIAHIRSEKVGGPRHDPTYLGDIDGHENLLLLCGKHHRPVDRHEQLYTIAELEEWKAAQRFGAAGGIQITDGDARSFVRLSDDERDAIIQVARLAERLSALAEDARNSLAEVEGAWRAARRQSFLPFAGTMEVGEDGSRTPVREEAYHLPAVEEHKWEEARQQVAKQHWPEVHAALICLREELAVLRMFGQVGGLLARRANDVGLIAQGVEQHFGSPTGLETSIGSLNAAVARLWRTANGEESELSEIGSDA
jgi:hypothetical protein